MWVLIGYAIIVVCVFGGFMVGGGHVAALFQPIELVIIGGAAAGAFVVGNGIEITRHTLHVLPSLFRPSPFTPALQTNVLTLIYHLMVKARREGFLSLEGDVKDVEKSALFSRFPDVLAHEEVVSFLRDTISLLVAGGFDAYKLEVLMDKDIENFQQQEHHPSAAVARLADGMPGFGIVAAVMGVVHTMESVGLPPEELGMLIARALVGTFLGILLAYGFVGPLASLMEHRTQERVMMLQALKTAFIAFAEGTPPSLSVEFARKALPLGGRPSAEVVEQAYKQP